jgi:hypothetical protein
MQQTHKGREKLCQFPRESTMCLRRNTGEALRPVFPHEQPILCLSHPMCPQAMGPIYVPAPWWAHLTQDGIKTSLCPLFTPSFVHKVADRWMGWGAHLTRCRSHQMATVLDQICLNGKRVNCWGGALSVRFTRVSIGIVLNVNLIYSWYICIFIKVIISAKNVLYFTEKVGTCVQLKK